MLLTGKTKTKAKWEIHVQVVFAYKEEEKRWINAVVSLTLYHDGHSMYGDGYYFISSFYCPFL